MISRTDSNASDPLLLRQLLFTQEEERVRIARELHDGIGHMLVLLHKNLSSPTPVGPDGQNMGWDRHDTAAQVQDILDELRRVTHRLIPMVLEDLGLDSAIQALARGCISCGIKTTLEIPKLNGSLSAERQVHFYRICQEVFSNIIKHSRATEASFSLCFNGDVLRCEISDNGIGFPVDQVMPPGTENHSGIRNMRARATLLAGSLMIESKKQQGTVITIEIPTDGALQAAIHEGAENHTTRRGST